MRYLIFVGLFALAAAQLGGQAPPNMVPECQTPFTYFNGSCYRQSGGGWFTPMGQLNRMEGMTWARANMFCQRLHPDAHLVVINDQSEHDFIFDWGYGIEPQEMWIGLYYNMTTMSYQWVNGDPLMYTSWEPFGAEPSVLQGGAGVMFMSEVFTRSFSARFGYGLEVSHYWNAMLQMEERLPFICEYEVMAPTTDQWNGTNTTMVNATTSPTFRPFPQAPTRGPLGPTRSPFRPTTGPFNPNPNPPVFRPQVMQQQPWQQQNRQQQPARLSNSGSASNWFYGPLQMRDVRRPYAYRRPGQAGARPKQYAMP